MALSPKIANYSRQGHRGVIPPGGSRDRMLDECTVLGLSSGLGNESFGSMTNDPAPTACREWNFDRSVHEATITSEV